MKCLGRIPLSGHVAWPPVMKLTRARHSRRRLPLRSHAGRRLLKRELSQHYASLNYISLIWETTFPNSSCLCETVHFQTIATEDYGRALFRRFTGNLHYFILNRTKPVIDVLENAIWQSYFGVGAATSCISGAPLNIGGGGGAGVFDWPFLFISQGRWKASFCFTSCRVACISTMPCGHFFISPIMTINRFDQLYRYPIPYRLVPHPWGLKHPGNIIPLWNKWQNSGRIS